MPTTHEHSTLHIVTQECNMQVTTRTKKAANMHNVVTTQIQLQYKVVVKMQQRYG